MSAGLRDAAEQSVDAPGGWFVYLLALSDCSAFKVGFTCNPLQRIYGFSRRYFERFDLLQSELLRVADRESARAIEAQLKHQLAAFRHDAPGWVPEAAGGHTEWFSAVYFGDAREQLHGCAGESNGPCLIAFDLLRAELTRRSSQLELWASQSADALAQPHADPRSAARVASALRDWLDACDYCAVPLFVDDRLALRRVCAAAQHLRGGDH